MTQKQSISRLRAILIVGIVLTLTFIWGNSMLSIPESREESLSLLELLTPFLNRVFGEGVITLHILRKAAHFCEFGLLGVLLSCERLADRRHGRKSILHCLAASLFVASADDTLQIFTGRGSQVRDVLLDFSGAMTGILGIFLIFRLCRRLRKH